MRKLTILQISDVHIENKNKQEIKEIIEKLIIDVKNVQEKNNINIDLICFNGDLVQRGNQALEGEEQWNIGMEIVINPLLDNLKLSKDNCLFVPGNHEVNTDLIIPRLEKGLQISSLKEINEIMDQFHKSYNERLHYFYELMKNYNSKLKFNTLGYSYKNEINNLNVGIACVDSSWRSSGKGYEEQGEMFISPQQIQQLYNNIEKCDIKICMMHHPVNWLKEFEQIEIEKKLAKFDLVLCGHVHETDLKQIVRKKMNTVYSTTGKLYPLDYSEGNAIDGYNGYSILNVDYERGKCIVYVRSYYAKNRQEFDDGINIIPNGKEEYNILSKEGKGLFEFEIVKGIEKYFNNMSEKYALIKEVDSQSPEDYMQVLVEPVLSDKSEYIKENGEINNSKEINIDDIILLKDNIIFIGKKECGKTTILQQIGLKYIQDYEICDVIPIHINMKYLSNDRNNIENCVIHFIQDNIIDDAKISKNQIKQIISSDKIIYLIDNVKPNNDEHTKLLTQYLAEHYKSRFILTIEEEFFQSLNLKEIPDYGNEFNKIYIQYMGKHQIRDMVTQWTKGKTESIDIEETVNRIDLYFNQINFAKTPFNISIFMVILDNDHNFMPINEGIVMENYMEIILEKFSSKESYRSTYSFKIKQNFLSYIAYNMYLLDRYFLTKEEFADLTIKYHNIKGYKLQNSKFDILFFQKNILYCFGQYIVFSHTSFLEYFLAIYALDDEKFLADITSKGKRVYFKNEICFYSGLHQNCSKLLDNLSDTILDIVLEYIDLVDNLNQMEIMAEFKIDKEKFVEDIQKNRLTQEELDKESDKKQQYIEQNPIEIKKNPVAENETEDFFILLQMYGSVIKNAELIDNINKKVHLEIYMNGMNMLYALLIDLFEFIRDNLYNDNSLSNEKVEGDSKEKVRRISDYMIDYSKLLFPIAIQNLILENVGTPKLEVPINELIETKQNKPFEKFMLTFLKCDLKLVDLKDTLKEYIKVENSEGILKIMLMKLTFYYKSRFFGNNIRIDNELTDLITEIIMKINPNYKYQGISKNKLYKSIKQNLDK